MPATQAEFQQSGKDVARPRYLVDQNGNPSFSIAINDPNTTTNKAKVGVAGDLTVSISNPNSALAGIYASVSAFGSLEVSIDPLSPFGDTFEGSIIDATNRWTVAGTVPPTQAAGLLSCNPGTGANATSVLVSQPLFTAFSAIVAGATITFESGTTALGNHRFFGLGTTPSGTGTAAAPLQDAIGFEIDTAGALRASVYAAGARVFTQALTMSTDGLPHRYIVVVRGDIAFWYKDTFDIPLAFTQLGTAAQTLPLRIASLNSASVTGTPTFVVAGAGMFDQSRAAQGLSDGTYPWRKATVDASGNLAVKTSTGTTGGATTFHVVSAATTNATSIKASAGQVYGYSVYNANAAVRFVKLFNKASAPTLGTDVPARTIGIPPGAQVAETFENGLAYGTGIAIATTTGIADLDVAAVALSDLSINLDYK
jgi:hypothetical protein